MKDEYKAALKELAEIEGVEPEHLDVIHRYTGELRRKLANLQTALDEAKEQNTNILPKVQKLEIRVADLTTKLKDLEHERDSKAAKVNSLTNIAYDAVANLEQYKNDNPELPTNWQEFSHAMTVKITDLFKPKVAVDVVIPCLASIVILGSTIMADEPLEFTTTHASNLCREITDCINAYMAEVEKLKQNQAQWN